MDLQLADKVAIVTGSSKGLGLGQRARARRGRLPRRRSALAARRRWTRPPPSSSALAGGADRVLAVAADLVHRRRASTPSSPARSRRFGGLDILVNNVGVAKGAGIADTTDAEWQAAFDQTLFPAIRASRLAVPLMRQRGGGAIVMIASIWGRESGGRMTYNAVKAAEISLAKAMAQQLARDNIRVNSVAPGSIRFPGGSWDRRVQDDPDGMAEFVRTRTAVRAVWPPRRGRGGRRVPGVGSRELDQRGKCDR